MQRANTAHQQGSGNLSTARGRAASGAASVAMLVAVLTAGAVAGAGPASAGSPTATDGTRTLAVSKADGLPSTGEAIRVSGTGYDVSKGIYVTFCVVPPPGQVPTPCGGGADMTGESTSSAWVSSNPPPYGVDLATPYGPGGTFSLVFIIGAQLNADVDCTVVSCAIVTRNDHTRPSDRSQDVVVPLTFVDPVGPTTPTTAAPTTTTPGAPTTTNPGTPTTAPTTTRPGTPATPATGPTQPGTPTPARAPGSGSGVTSSSTSTTVAVVSEAAVPPPPTTSEDDGRTSTDGRRRLTLAAAADLDPAGQPVRVTGSGFDTDKALSVRTCVLPEPPATRPDRCATSTVTAGPGKVEATIAPVTRPSTGDLMPDGTFEVTVTIPAAIDDDTRCGAAADGSDAVVRCGVVVGNDASRPSDGSQDLTVPVTFGAGASGESAVGASGTTAAGAQAPEDGSTSGAAPVEIGSGGASPAGPLVAVVLVVLAAIAAAVTLGRQRGRAGESTMGPGVGTGLGPDRAPGSDPEGAPA